MALPQDNYKQQYGDSLGTSAALNETINTFLTLSMDRQNTGGIYWHYYGGDIRVGNTVTTLVPGILILTNPTNYIQVNKNGTVSFNAVGFSANQIPVAIVTVVGGAITSYIDKRTFLNGDIAVPAGNDKEVQFNDGGVFGADPAFIWDKTTDRLGINIATPLSKVHIATIGEVGFNFWDNHNNALTGNYFIGRKSRGTQASPTAILANDQMMGFNARGYKATGFSATCASIILIAAENFTDTATGTYIQFNTNLKGTTTASNSMTFNPKGNLIIGLEGTTIYKFVVWPDVAAGNTPGKTALFYDGVATAGITTVDIKAGAGQSTSNLQQWQDISANVMASMSQTVFTSPATLQLKNGTKFNSFTNSGSQAAGTLAYTLPSGMPAATGYVLSATTAGVMSWIAAGGTPAVPGGNTTAVQVNVGGAFWGDETQFWHDTSINTLGISLGKIQIQSAGTAGGLNGMAINNAGSGYTLDDILYVSTTPGSGGYIKVTGVDGGGGVTSFSVYRRGINYTVSSGIMATGGTGTNLYININSIMDISNPALSLIDVHGTKQNTFKVSDEQTASTNIDYILPASYPATTGDVMSCTTDGIMSWNTAGGGGGSSPFTQDGTTFSIRRTDESLAGYTRGDSAIDLVYNRANASMVASGDYSGILSGIDNTNDGLRSVVCGGKNNIIMPQATLYGDAYYGGSFIGAGSANYCGANTRGCFIGSGYANQIAPAGANATDFSMHIIVGGNQNKITFPYYNGVSSTYCNFIGGGQLNEIASFGMSVICGGELNAVGGFVGNMWHGFVGGGKSNAVNGDYGCIPGGRSNMAGAYSFAAGYNAQATTGGAFCFADGTLTRTSRANQAKFGVAGGFTIRTNAGGTGLFDFYTTGGNDLTTPNGAVLTVGGVWTDASSRALKTKIADIDNADILQKVNSISPERWKYKTEAETDTEHIGLYAEDFYNTFGVGNDKGLGATDLCGVLWAAVQELSKQVSELKNKIQ